MHLRFESIAKSLCIWSAVGLSWSTVHRLCLYIFYSWVFLSLVEYFSYICKMVFYLQVRWCFKIYICTGEWMLQILNLLTGEFMYLYTPMFNCFVTGFHFCIFIFSAHLLLTNSCILYRHSGVVYLCLIIHGKEPMKLNIYIYFFRWIETSIFILTGDFNVIYKHFIFSFHFV